MTRFAALTAWGLLEPEAAELDAWDRAAAEWLRRSALLTGAGVWKGRAL